MKKVSSKFTEFYFSKKIKNYLYFLFKNKNYSYTNRLGANLDKTFPSNKI